jgi:formate hydrogenlyase subunit 3/multisubunit Na+/H+ antiporter MnhD subunit
VEQRAGHTDTERLGGLGSKMPWTNATSPIGSLSAAGIPPMAGFWSKLIIVIALWQSAHFGWAALAVLMSAVTLGYLLVMQRRVFFGKTPEAMAAVGEAKPGIVLASVILAGVTVGVGVLFFLLVNTFLLLGRNPFVWN